MKRIYTEKSVIINIFKEIITSGNDFKTAGACMKYLDKKFGKDVMRYYRNLSIADILESLTVNDLIELADATTKASDEKAKSGIRVT